jgi:hypothetical protein
MGMQAARSRRSGDGVLMALIAVLVGCSGSGSGSAPGSGSETKHEPAPSTPSAAVAAAPVPEGPAPAPDPSLPVSKRMQGRWRLDVDKVPDIALTKQFRDIKKQGQGKQVRIEYLVTDTEFTVTNGSRGPVLTRFDYEIASEESDRVLLKRLDDQGKQQQINVVLREDDVLRIGTGSGEVPLQRVALPEKVR